MNKMKKRQTSKLFILIVTIKYNNKIKENIFNLQELLVLLFLEATADSERHF